MIRAILDWIVSLFRRGPAVAEPQKPKTKRARREKDHFGVHYYLGDLLNALESIFEDLPLLKKSDPDAYAMINRWGAVAVSSDVLVYEDDLDPFMAKHLPSFGAHHSGPSSHYKKGQIPARFVYFRKERRPTNVQAANGAIYCCGATYHIKGKPIATTFYVSLAADGTVTPLRVCTPKRQKPGFCRMEWGYPWVLQALAEDHEMTPEQIAVKLFTACANVALARNAGLTVRVSRGKSRAVFAIDLLRTPYFFADRQKTVNERGRTKPIVHLVKGHWRTKSGGGRKWVKSHFRGVREFEWNGYDVKVGLAGKHGAALSDFDVAQWSDRPDPKFETLTADEVAERMDGHIV